MAKRKINYRAIWERHYGDIPKDDLGRSYEIHHIDGNRDNNDISNLVCVSVDDHYKIHFEQNDYYACASIKKRMNMSEEDRKLLSEKIASANRSRPNPFNDPAIQSKCKATWKLNYTKENHPFFGKKRPDHSEHMKSIGWGKNKTEEHLANHRKAWIESTKDNPIRAKVWTLIKDGIEFQVKNLKKYCRDNGLKFSRIYGGGEDNGVRLA